MIYVDELRNYGDKLGEWCHMWADSEDELHSFAKSLGLQRHWMHRSYGISGDFKHYDLRPGKRAAALKRGAQFKPLKDYIAERWTRGES